MFHQVVNGRELEIEIQDVKDSGLLIDDLFVGEFFPCNFLAHKRKP